MTNLSFEHFDPELELGHIDENGKPVRPRKKPGRKPNPPSPAQRKAQNRAAQRAFRERKRREMKEAETTVKKCLYARDLAIREANKLKRRLEELTFEANYLKGYVLTLKMTCIANRVEVPKFWDNGVTDDMGADGLTFSKTKGIPQSLEFFLDKSLNIVTSCQEEDDKTENNLSSFFSTSSYLADQPDSPSTTHSSSASEAESYDSTDSFNNEFETVNNEEETSMLDINQSLSSIAPQLASHLESPFFQRLLNADLVGSENAMMMMETEQSDTIPTHHDDVLPDTPSSLAESIPSLEEEPVVDSKTGQLRTVTDFDPDKKRRSISQEKKVFPPMTPLDAISHLRAAKNLDETTRALFTPTELQRNIRHDTRIDCVPGAAMRDHMILFQDFYDANELFDYLAENSVFLGGELGNQDAWFVPPTFLRRYWFLCPNHKSDRLDNSVDIMVNLGKKMIQLMFERKKMYIEREQHKELFPNTHYGNEKRSGDIRMDILTEDVPLGNV
ncbi:hypothetical protein K501DRAFT_241617 [Backusella circina FSU 941]|nr:hypothetical protein K501DRAFT_241617 [Backusella circina FSU 941]